MTLGNFMKTVDGDTMALFTICNIYNAEYTHQFLYDKTVKYIKENKLASKKVTRIGIDYNDSCLNMRKYLKNGTFGGIIFSPPYANCFDYTEIYKLELWFGEFVNSYKDMKFLRTKSIRSHLNGNLCFLKLTRFQVGFKYYFADDVKMV